MTSQPFRMSQLGRHSLIYGLGTVLNRAVAVVMLPIYTRFLTPADYGILQLVSMLIEVTAIIAGARLANGIFHFYHKAETTQDRNAVLSTALSVITLSYVTITFAAAVVAPVLADVVFGSRGQNVLFIRLACSSLAFESLIVVPLAHIQLRRRSVLFVVVNATKLILQVILNVILLIPLHMGVTGVLISTLVANMAIGVWLAVQLLRSVRLHFSPAVAGRLIRFGLPLVATQISTFVLTFGDRYFLNKAGGTAVVGIYGLAYQFSFMLVSLGYLPFHTVWSPSRFEIAKLPNRNELYARAFIYLNILLFTMAVVLALFTKDLLRIMAAPAFHGAATLVPVLLVASVLQVWSMYHNLGIYISERTEYYALATWLSALVVLAGYIWLIPRMLAWGAVLATVIAYAFRFLAVYVFSQRLWFVRYRWGPVIRLSTIAALISAAGFLAPDTGIGVSILLRSALLALYLVGIWVFGVFSEADRAFLRRAVRAPRTAVSALMG